eukprot:3386217-Rhodomonas_salina.1
MAGVRGPGYDGAQRPEPHCDLRGHVPYLLRDVCGHVPYLLARGTELGYGASVTCGTELGYGASVTCGTELGYGGSVTCGTELGYGGSRQRECRRCSLPP